MDFEIDAKIAEYEARGARQAMLGLTDIDGVLRGKYVGFDKLKSLFAKGGGFCGCVFGWDVDDQLYDGGAVTGWHSGFPDARYRLLSASERALPESGTPYFVGEFASDDANDHPVCPRTLLRRILARADGLGLTAKAGFEYELFVFDEDADSVRDKGFGNLQPLTPGNFGYSVLRAASNSEIFQALMDYCADFRMPLEGLHCETGPGVWEAALAVADGLEAADRAALFKTFSKAFFAKRGAMATFMAKWSMDYPGQSGHYHFSLLDSAGANVFADASTDVPDRARWALGGLVRYAGEFLPMLAPTINSYTRLVKGAWAPTAATWGSTIEPRRFGSFRGTTSRSTSRLGSAAPTATRTWLRRRPSGRPSWALNNGSNHPRPCPAMPTTWKTASRGNGGSRPRFGMRRIGSANPAWPGNCSANSSSTTMCPPGSGNPGSTNGTSTTGSSRATSRSSSVVSRKLTLVSRQPSNVASA